MEKYEELIDAYVFLPTADFKLKVNEMVMKQLTNIKPEKLDEHVIKNHVQQLIDLKDKMLQIQDTDLLLESSIRIFKAIDNVNIFNKDTLLESVKKVDNEEVVHWDIGGGEFFTFYKDDNTYVIKTYNLPMQDAKILLEFLKQTIK